MLCSISFLLSFVFIFTVSVFCFAIIMLLPIFIVLFPRGFCLFLTMYACCVSQLVVVELCLFLRHVRVASCSNMGVFPIVVIFFLESAAACFFTLCYCLIFSCGCFLW